MRPVFAVIASLVAVPAVAEFRVNPYLQSPSSDGMYFTWFTASAEAAALSITGPGLDKPLVLSSVPTFEGTLAYTNAELNQNLNGLDKGSWLVAGDNYKHSIDVRSLQANATYQYAVTQGGSVFQSSFKTAPTPQAWSSIRFIAMSDSETEPAGRTTRREWQPGALGAGSLDRPSSSIGGAWDQKFGTRVQAGVRILNYSLTEDEGYRRNMAIVNSRKPDFLMMPGDLVQGGGYQPGWDEFFRQNAGSVASGLSSYPILPALGNWENFGALNGGYGNDADGRFGPKFGRDKYHVYFDAPDNGTPAHRDNYYRVDYGPITIITLDSSNGLPDDRPQNHPNKAVGTEFNGPGTDTQNNFTKEQYEAAGGTDLADFNPGSVQSNWAKQQLADARARGQIVFVQFHHAPYSNGEHGVPMDHALTTGQGGTPMRQYQPMFEQYGVAAVLSGHSEMFERSFVDSDGDGIGVQYYDVGVSGDGLRSGKKNGSLLSDPALNYNSFSRWTADQSAPERWELVDGVLQLVEGGKHYGHLEVEVEHLGGENLYAKVTLTPVHIFPVLDSAYNLVETQRRLYDDVVTVYLNAAGQVVAVPEPSQYAMLLAGLALVGFAARRRV
jgi:3',5'-cyclic AMP phosphodiesterase CpdA